MRVEHRRRPVIHTDLSVYLALAELKEALDSGSASPPKWIFDAIRAGELTSSQLTVIIRALDKEPRIAEALIKSAIEAAASESMQKTRSRPLDEFVMGQANERTVRLVQSLLSRKARDLAPPIFITGNPGTGKSHLLRMLVQQLRNSGQSAELIRPGSDDFTRLWSTSMAKGRLLGEPRSWLIDDADLATGEQISNMLRIGPQLCQQGHRVVVCGRPSSILNSSSLLKGWELTELAQPDAEMMRSILDAQCRERGIRLSEAGTETLIDLFVGRPELIRPVIDTLAKLSGPDASSVPDRSLASIIRRHQKSD